MHIPAHLKVRTVIRDHRQVQVKFDEEAVGVVRLAIDTNNCETSLIVGETGIRELAQLFAGAVARMDAHAADLERGNLRAVVA